MALMECGSYRGQQVASKRKQSGFIQKGFLVVVAVFLASAGNYLFSINQNAVHGYRIRTLEKEIAKLRDEKNQLDVRVAEERSLDRTKEVSSRLGMERTTDVVSVERLGAVAMR